MEIVNLGGVPRESKIALLKELGYALEQDGVHIRDVTTGKRVIDRYTNIEVSIDRMMILPGSTILLDDNEFSLMSYIEEKGDIF